MLIYICIYGKDVDILATYILNRECDGWAHTPGVSHLSMVCSLGPYVVLLSVYYQ